MFLPQLILLALAIAAAAAPIDEGDSAMLKTARADQATHHYQSSQLYTILPATDYTHIRALDLRALELAHSGARFVGHYPNLGPELETKRGEQRMYFYSLIPPTSELGQEMRLQADGERGVGDRLGSALYRYEDERGDGQVRLVNIDTIVHRQGVRWPLEELEGLFHRHWAV